MQSKNPPFGEGQGGTHMKKEDLIIYNTPEELAGAFADQLMDWIGESSGNSYHLAISGGKTPDLLFKTLAGKFADSPLWEKVHFWWVDERMVPPAHPESNFGVAQKLLFSKITIPEANIHRIKGENTPEIEALSYSAQILEKIPLSKDWPVFDLILLGMGDDGHTASIFPDQMHLLISDQICAVATHPSSGQKRITLTGTTINNARKVCFLVTGQAKAERISEILSTSEKANRLPAKFIQPASGNLGWYVDKATVQAIL